MYDTLDTIGWFLVVEGLFLVIATAALALVHSDDAPWQAFAWLYGVAWTMVYLGFRVLKWIGHWPPRT